MRRYDYLPPAEDESTANPLSLGEMFLLLCIDDREIVGFQKHGVVGLGRS